MNDLKQKIRTKVRAVKEGGWENLFLDEDGAIDLASIMVGIIVIGLIGGVIAATVFAVIPWTQDNAAKQQLNSIVQAENAYYGLSAAVPSTLPAGYTPNSYTDSPGLANASLLVTGPAYCVVTANAGKGYQGFSASGSGAIFTVTDANSNPVSFTGTLPSACAGITASTAPAAAPAAYVDPTPTITKITLKCDTAQTGSLPFQNLKGTESWSDGTKYTYSVVTAASTQRTLAAGTTYQVTFDGTFTDFHTNNLSATYALAPCIRSLDYWGANSGTTKAGSAFQGATNLTSVPAHIPTTVTDLDNMFQGASAFNDPNISNWDVSNVTDMSAMFYNAAAFNQPLNSWNTGKVTTMNQTFFGAAAFNQPLGNWNTANVTNMYSMFLNAAAFNQPIGNWNTSKVTTLGFMFHGASAFNQNINTWDTSSNTSLTHTFDGASSFNQPLNNWNTSNVTDMSQAFYNASVFNQPLNNWNTAKVTRLSSMFLGATAFNQDIHMWNTAAVTTGNGTTFVPTAFPNAYMPPNTSK